MGLKSDDLARLSPAAQKQVMQKMQKQGKYKAQKTQRGRFYTSPKARWKKTGQKAKRRTHYAQEKAK